jgi:uncharacterized protein (DUF2062 family)
MARSPAEIQADIALTRRVIERQLDTLTPRVSRLWRTPWAVAAGALTVGLALSRVPLLRVIGAGARALQAGITIAGTVAAIDRFVSHRRPPVA